MNTQQSLEQMKSLRLHGMAASYESQLNLPVDQQLEGHELLAHLLHAERLYKGNARTSRLLKSAKLRLNAIPENIIYSAQRNLSKSVWTTLLECNYIREGQSVLITGKTGTGKSWLACALGYQACLMGYKTSYFSMHRLIEEIVTAKVQGSYVKLLNRIKKADVLVLDDFGLQSPDKQTKLALLQIMEERYANKATIVASQLPISAWHAYLDEPTLADAFCDRLTAKSHRLELKGPSMRRETQPDKQNN